MKYKARPYAGLVEYTQIIEMVVMTWPNACITGRIRAADHMIGLSPEEIFEYVGDTWPDCLPRFLDECGWEQVPDEPPFEIKVGMWVQGPYSYSTPGLVVSTPEDASNLIDSAFRHNVIVWKPHSKTLAWVNDPTEFREVEAP